MSTAVQTLLTAFNALSDADKHVAAVAIMKQAIPSDSGDLSEATFCEIADELFQQMDRRESENAQS